MPTCQPEIASAPPLSLWGGVECTINRVGDGYFDQIRLSGHDLRPDDLARIAELGVSELRYPLLWEAFARTDDVESLWAWHEERLTWLRGAGIRPIIGLIHHGSGPPTTDLLQADFAPRLAEHAAAAARRFAWVETWSPVNEPVTTARFAALYGLWYPHRSDEAAFWLALLNQVDGVRAAMAAIRAVNPDAKLIQTEDIGFTSATPERQGQADYYNLRRWASWDLLTGRFDRSHPFWQRLANMGFEQRLHAIAAAPCPPDMLGLNHYLTSDRFLDHRLDRHPSASHGDSFFGPLADVEAVRAGDCAPGFAGALRDCWDRYGLPIAITEVHNGSTREEQMRWFRDAWDAALQQRQAGVRVEAVTAWSLLGAFDWDSLLTQQRGAYESGVFDVRSAPPRATAMAGMLQALAASKIPDHPVLAGQGWWRRGAEAKLFAQAPRRPDVRPLLITGATGTLGQAFAGACRLRDIDHVLVGRDCLDLGDPAGMAKLLLRMNPWAVVNCAGWVRVDDAEAHAQECLAANFTGSIALAEACRHLDIHYTTFSSDLVFDGQAQRPYVESDVTAPQSVYGRSKARADAALAAAGGRALVIRTASFFSPFDQHNFAVHLAGALHARQPFRAAADCITSPTYVPDLVRATLDLIIDDTRGLWHLASEGALSWAEFALEIGSALGLPTGLIDAQPAASMGWAAPRPAYAPLTSERGLIMPSLESAIARFVAEYQRNGREAGAAAVIREQRGRIGQVGEASA